MKINSISSKEAIAFEERYGAHNYHPLPVVLSKGEGVYLYSPEGKKYFDFLAGYGAVNQGHCHPRLVQAVQEQVSQLTLTSRAFHNNLLGLAEQKVTGLFGYDRALFMNSGAEANETAIKMVRKWGYLYKNIPANKAKIIALRRNFHGRTLAIISASTDENARKDFGPFIEGFEIIEPNQIHLLEDALRDSNVAGFLMEPIQGEAGVYLPDKGYLKKAADLCKRANILLMVDEIQTGLGRTGKMLASDYENVKPDVLILGKSLSGGMLPVSVVLSSDEVMGVFKPGQHGSTYGGNPLACKVTMEALDIIIQEQLPDHAFKMGEIFRNTLSRTLIQEMRHPMVKEIRGLGLMNAIEVKSHRGFTAMDICLRMMEAGLLAKPTHEHIIRLTPPLIIKEMELLSACTLITQVFAQVL